MDAKTPPTIDERESQQRVLAAVGATILVGWTLYAVSQVASGSGSLLPLWGVACAWGLVCCVALVFRACGLRKGRATWLFPGGYGLVLAFISLLGAGIGQWFATQSMIVLVVLAVLGYRLERPSPLPVRPADGS